MIKVLFFAQFRERLGIEQIEIEKRSLATVDQLIEHLAKQIPQWKEEIDPSMCLCAVNQTLVRIDHPLNDYDEVAFFPPVTGG